MSFLDRAIEAVAGRGLAERHEHRRLEKAYKNAPQILRESTSVTREPVAEGDSDVSCRSTYARTEPLPQRQPREGSIRPYRCPLQRTQSELVEKKAPVEQFPSRPPDITAWEMPDEQVTRTYSFSCAAGVKRYRLPPMPKMEGIGCFRVAVEADDNWKIDHVQRCIRGYECFYDKSDRLGLADSHPELWERYQKSIRRDSFASATSSRSGSSVGFHEETVDPQTGTRVSRGFLPSNPSSAASSFRESGLHRRRDSGLSTQSISGEADNNFNKTMSRQSALRTGLSNGSDPLATIDEAQGTDSKPPRRKSVPCLFDVDGDPESAMASIDNESHDQSSAWVETCSVDGQGGITEMLKQINCPPQVRKAAPQHASKLRQKPRPEAKKGLDRSKTIRAAPKGFVRRSTSDQKRDMARGQKSTKDTSADSEAVGTKAKTTSKSISSDESDAVYMADAKGQQQGAKVTVSSKDETDQADQTSPKSDSTATTLVTGMGEPQQKGVPRSRRTRSATTIRTCSGDIGPVMERTPSTEIEGN